MSKLKLSLLGSPELMVDDAPAHVDTRKAIALLAYLAITGRTQSRDHLAGLLWPDYDQDRARAALRRTLSTLRSTLGGRWVTADRAGVSFDPSDSEVDLLELRRALAQTSAHEHPATGGCPACLATLREVLQASAGDFMQGFYLRDSELFDEWQSGEAEASARQLSEALDALIRLQSASGDIDGAIATAERRLARDPLSEATHRHLMQLHAWKGARAAAVRQYRQCVAVLERELGVQPLDETTELYSAIVEGAIEADTSPTLPAPARRKPAGPAPTPGPAELPLVGREQEVGLVVETYERIQRSGALAVIEGEAGIGKTRLVRELMAHANRAGARVVGAGCHEGESGLPYAVITDALTNLPDAHGTPGIRPASFKEAARLVPGIGGAEPSPSSDQDAGSLTRLYEGLLDVIGGSLSGDAPGMLVFEDLHWADGASLDFLAYLSRRLDGIPICLVVSWRTGEFDEAGPLRRAATTRGGLDLVLHRLDADDVRELATEVLSPDEVQRFGDALFEESEGVPFFVVEYITTMRGRGGASRMPAGVKELLRTRVELVGAAARQLLTTAAVIDRSFDFDALLRASGRSELETVDALDELVRHGLVTHDPLSESVSPSYVFSHDKLRAFIYEEMSPARRRVLHRRVADALLASSPKHDGVSALAGPIARHYELGGKMEEAALLHAEAGRLAAGLFANREALDHYMSALALGHTDMAELYERAGDMRTLLGEYSEAVTSYETAAALAGPDELTGIERKLGDVHLRRGDWDLAESHLEASLASGVNGRARARVLADLSLTAWHKKARDRAEELAQLSLATATSAQDKGALAQAHNVLGILARARGSIEESVDHLSMSLTLAEELDEPDSQVAALNNLALAERSRNEIRKAMELTEQALAICRRRGDRHREAALHNNMADLFHAIGDSTRAMDHLKLATSIFAEIGTEPSGMLPEVWKLIEW